MTGYYLIDIRYLDKFKKLFPELVGKINDRLPIIWIKHQSIRYGPYESVITFKILGDQECWKHITGCVDERDFFLSCLILLDKVYFYKKGTNITYRIIGREDSGKWNDVSVIKYAKDMKLQIKYWYWSNLIYWKWDCCYYDGMEHRLESA